MNSVASSGCITPYDPRTIEGLVGKSPPPAPPRIVRLGVGVVAFRGYTFLVAERLAGCKSGVGQLALPGGTIEFGESIYVAAVRELLEETGLVGVPLEEYADRNYVFHAGERIADGEHHITLYVASRVVGGRLKNPEPHKHSGWEFHTFGTLDRLGKSHWVPVEAIAREKFLD